MKILGISAFYHDSAAALLVDGKIVAAAQEERFTRIKHDQSYPENAVRFCIEHAGLEPTDIDFVAFYDKPYTKFGRLLQTYLAYAPRGFKAFRHSIPAWLGGKLFQKQGVVHELKKLDCSIDWSSKMLFSEHHLSHAASAFYPSPFETAAILTMDGVGEWATTSLALGRGRALTVIKEIHFPHSLGLLYSAFTSYTGFKVNSGEYKVMGLAPYGEPRYVDLIKTNLIDIKEDGSFRLNLDYFDYCTGLQMTNEKFHKLFDGPPRELEIKLTQREMDLAASIQSVTEEVVIKLAKSIAKETGERNLCLAGGVALNCVANGKLLRKNLYENIWIQPAAGDAGGALGAAFAAYYKFSGAKRVIEVGKDSMQGSFLGPEYTDSEISESLLSLDANFELVEEQQAIEQAAHALLEGKAIGWHQGRMEFGPRALGSRSIIGDARSPSMQKVLNLKVKFRESFRPFAPSVLREQVGDWFEHDEDSPYMMFVANLKDKHRIQMTEEDNKLFGIDKLNVKRSSVPAITHVDYSARIQTVHKSTNPKYYALISKFNSLTECPMIVNTSFNVRGEPIVNKPEDAFRCFMGTGIEMLVIGNCILRKENQKKSLLIDYTGAFELD